MPDTEPQCGCWCASMCASVYAYTHKIIMPLYYTNKVGLVLRMSNRFAHTGRGYISLRLYKSEPLIDDRYVYKKKSIQECVYITTSSESNYYLKLNVWYLMSCFLTSCNLNNDMCWINAVAYKIKSFFLAKKSHMLYMTYKYRILSILTFSTLRNRGTKAVTMKKVNIWMSTY